MNLSIIIDPNVETIGGTTSEVIKMAKMFRGLQGVSLNVGPSIRICGYGLIRQLYENTRLPIFADLRLFGEKEVLETDAIVLRSMPGLKYVSISAYNNINSIKGVREVLPKEIKIFLVSNQTSNQETRERVMRSVYAITKEYSLGGMICSTNDLLWMRSTAGFDLRSFEVFIPNVTSRLQPTKSSKADGSTLISEAYSAGASGVIVKDPITKFSVPVDAAALILAEISSLTKKR